MMRMILRCLLVFGLASLSAQAHAAGVVIRRMPLVLSIVLAARSEARAETPERSLSVEYRAALESLLPLTTPTEERFWARDGFAWWTTVRVLPSSRDDREIQITIWADQVGELHAFLRSSTQKSIFRQVEAAYDALTPINADKIQMTNVDVSRSRELKALVADLKQVRQEALPDTGLIMDPHVYDFVALSQSRSIRLHMLAAPGSVHRTNSLIGWIDKAKKVFLRTASRSSAEPDDR